MLVTREALRVDAAFIGFTTVEKWGTEAPRIPRWIQVTMENKIIIIFSQSSDLLVNNNMKR